MDKIILIKLIIMWSNIYGVDPKLALSVAQVESNFNPNAISKTGDYGLFQLNEQSFPQYSKEDLLKVEINITEGIQYLKKMKKECKFKDENDFLVCWNLGKRKANTIHYPKLWPFRKKVLTAMKGF